MEDFVKVGQHRSSIFDQIMVSMSTRPENKFILGYRVLRENPRRHFQREERDENEDPLLPTTSGRATRRRCGKVRRTLGLRHHHLPLSSKNFEIV